MAAASCCVNAAANGSSLHAVTTAPRQQQCGRMPNPIACGRHDDGRPTLTGQLPRPMGFAHRHRQRRFLQALARQGGTTPGMPRLRPHTGSTKGGAFVCLISSLLRRLAHCPLPACTQRTAAAAFSSTHRRTRPRSHHFRLVVPPSGLPAGKQDGRPIRGSGAPEHHALALTGSRLGELAPTLTTEFQDNAVRRFAWRPDDGRLDHTLRQLCQRNRDGSHNTQAGGLRKSASLASCRRTMQLGVAERRYVTNVSKARELGTGLNRLPMSTCA